MRLLLISLFALLLMAPAGLANEADRGFLTRLLEDNLSDAGREVRITGFEGALSSRATIAEITIADDDGIWLELRGAVLDWTRAALLRGEVDVNELTAREIIIHRLPDTGESGFEARGPFSLPDLPVAVRIGTIAAERVELRAPLLGSPAVITLAGTMNLAGGEGTVDIAANRIDGAQGSLRMQAGFANESRVLVLSMALEEGPGGIAATALDLPDRPALALGIDGAGPLENFAADISLATDGQERVAGQVELLAEQHGDDEMTRRFRLDIAGDLTPLLAEDLRPVIGTHSRLAAEGAQHGDGRMELSDLTLQTEAMALSGAVRLGPDRLPERIALEGRIAMRDGSAVVLPFTEPRARIDTAGLSLRFDASESADWHMQLDINGFRNPDLQIARLSLDGIGQIASVAGEDTIDAVLDFAAAGIAATDPALAEALGESASGSVSLIWNEGRPVQLPGLLIDGADYRISGAGEIVRGEYRGRIDVHLENMARYSALTGRSLSGAMQGGFAGIVNPFTGAFDILARVQGRDLTVDHPELDRLLSGESDIQAAVRRDQQGLHMRGFTLDVQTLVLSGFGTATRNRTVIEAEMLFSDLSVLGGGWGGTLLAEARFSDHNGVQTLEAGASGRDLRYGQPELDRLLAGETRMAMRVHRAGEVITFEEFGIAGEALAAMVSGQWAEGASDIVARLRLDDLSRLRPGFGGSFETRTQLTEGPDRVRHLSVEAMGNDLRTGNPYFDLIAAGTTRLDMSAALQGNRLRVDRAELRNPQGHATLSADITDELRRLELQAQLDTLATLVPGFDGAARLSGRIDETAAGYVLDLHGSGPAGLDISVSGQMQPNLRADLALAGSGDLVLLNPVISPVLAQGPFRFDLRLNGPLVPASLSGRVSTAEARIVSLNAGITVENILGSLDLAGGRANVALAGDVAAGGRLRASGSVGLAAALDSNLQVTVDAIRLVDPQLYETTATGTVTVTGPLVGGPLVSGALRLTETEIRIPSTVLAGTGFIPQRIRHVNETATARQTRVRAGVLQDARATTSATPIRLDLSLDSPNRIFVRGRGLDAELGGFLRLGGTVLDVVPTGEFGLIRGRLDLLGNRFTLSEGFASLQGQFIPFIRLAATTMSDGISTTVSVEGLATEPAIRFTSSPELPDEEIVSRLIFGRDLTSLSPFQAAQLASAVATLTGRGGPGLVERLRDGFGLDDLDITTDDSGTSALRAGRYVAENVYTDISVDSQGRSEISINLDVTPSLTVRGRVDTEGRTGLGLYFERDY